MGGRRRNLERGNLERCLRMHLHLFHLFVIRANKISSDEIIAFQHSQKFVGPWNKTSHTNVYIQKLKSQKLDVLE